MRAYLFLSPAEEAAEHVAHGLCRVLGVASRLLGALLPNFLVGDFLVGGVENLFLFFVFILFF